MVSTAVTPVPSLQDALMAFESKQQALANADSTQQTAGDAVTAAQQRLDAANTTKTQADAADNQAAGDYNAATDDLVLALQASKRTLVAQLAPTTGGTANVTPFAPALTT